MEHDKQYDVIVIGGGPSGSLAAWAAARMGAATLLIDEGAYLGGMLTKSGVGPQMSYHAGTTQVVRGLPERLIRKMSDAGFSPGHFIDPVGFASSITPFDPEGLKIIWEQSLLDDGVELLYYTRLIDCHTTDETIKSITVLGRERPFTLKAKVYVDACGADLAARSGCTILYGRAGDGLAQPMTMNLRVAGVDRDALIDFIQSDPDDFHPHTPVDQLRELPRLAVSGAYSVIRKAKAAGDFPIDRDMVLAFETNRRGEFIINMSRVTRKSSLISSEMTRAEIEGRQQAWQLIRFLNHYVGGFEQAYLLSTGPQIGIREGRRIQAVYQLKPHDLVTNRVFPDTIACGGYPIDIHSPDGAVTSYEYLREGSWYGIPYRSLITPEVRNLLVAGRSLGADHEALAAVRVSPILEAVGQAAGTAAALAAIESCPDTRRVDIETLRSALKREGVFLENYPLEI